MRGAARILGARYYSTTDLTSRIQRVKESFYAPVRCQPEISTLHGSSSMSPYSVPAMLV
jgi:hypothetical protein